MLQAMVEWKEFHNREAKRLKGGLWAAVPRNVSPLRYIGGYPSADWTTPDPMGLVKEMRSIINHEDFASASKGWDLALREADPRFLWETLILDRNAGYASLWSDHQRAIVVSAIADTYARFAVDG